jgi:hypothetical protein
MDKRFKGIMSPVEYFFEDLYNEISPFCTCAGGFQIFNLSIQEKNLYEVFACFFSNTY